MTIIHDIYLAVNGGARLEDVIPAGADITYWERRLNSYDPNAAPKKSPKKSSSKSGSGRRSKRSSYFAMQSVLASATLELVERVNRPASVRFCAACQLGRHCGGCACCASSTAAILVNNLVSGSCQVVEVAR